MKKSKIFKDWIRAILIALFLVLIIRGLLFQSYVVKSTQMENALYSGDYVLVNKVSTGARLPITLLSLPFTDIYSEFIQLPYLRFPSFFEIEINDLLVFNYPAIFDTPVDKGDAYIKRCLGLPGDTIMINNKIAYNNNLSFDEKLNLRFQYRIITDGTGFTDNYLDSLNITEGGVVSDMGIFDFLINDKTAKIITDLDYVRNVRIKKDYPRENTSYTFPSGKFIPWNKDYFGPVVIPQKGVTVKINYKNIDLYKDIIDLYEDNLLEIIKHKIFINNIEVSEYTFKQNYYFVIDDNRDNAKDSRYWGFLPETHIIGTASFIWFSLDKNKSNIRWNRIFKSIN